MTGIQSSRAEILKKIRGTAPPRAAEDAMAEYAELPREYRRRGLLEGAALQSMLEHRLLEYDARVYHALPDSLPQRIAQILAQRGHPRMIVPRGLTPGWLPGNFSFHVADEMPAAELDEFDGLICGCTAAIALTGTLVLQNAPGQGPRKLSLVPDYLLCIVSGEDIVETVPEGFHKIEETSRLPTTFISGPSATADIEMTRIKGVHGPRSLDVILLE